ncbi:DNA-3-methyladenine glycosylase III [Amphibacillus marinus]|uniref:DNA-3-methyladenine glycosylase III n=1 Tax=Amphibacillus marinus TaxID=872970 RepID=A0A1H8K8T9_9BACI|nr:endonuclease [Amphibacillus marinus]SEN89121.1 DNA-3-methyladenine glycosylase III [Amphibacillus marinus]
MSVTYLDIFTKLHNYYGDQEWWPAETTLEMMVGAILVQNTAWTNVEKALKLLMPYLDAALLRNMPTEQLEQLIRPSGFFRLKTKRLQAFLEWYFTYNFDHKQLNQHGTATLREELLTIYGIGPETADSILLYACNRPVFVVDAYLRRLMTRIGFDLPSSYEAIRQQFEQVLPLDVQLFNEFHALIVTHAKTHCKKKPICEGCPLVDSCQRRFIKENNHYED